MSEKTRAKAFGYEYKRPDEDQALKWSGKRVVRDETNLYVDPGIDFSGDPGLTDPSHSKDSDVNEIVAKFMKTGVLPGVNRELMFADFSTPMSYHEALNTVIHAQEQFDSLNAHVRARFQNDPEQFLAFVNDPKNAQEMISLGLATERLPSDADRIVGAIGGLKPPSPADPDPNKSG